MKLTVYTLYNDFPLVFVFRVFLTLSMLVAGVLLAIWLFKTGKLNKYKRNILIICWLYVQLILFFTVIGRYSHEEYTVRLELFFSYKQAIYYSNTYEWFGIIVNIMMFIPFGVMIAELFNGHMPVLIAFLAGMFFTLLIESLQIITHTGTFEVDDVLNNMIGTIFGTILWLVCNLFRKELKEKE